MAGFNQSKYIQEYMKQHYKEIKIRVRPEIAADFDRLAAASGLSRSAAIVAAVRYCLDNNIDIGAAAAACEGSGADPAAGCEGAGLDP